MPLLRRRPFLRAAAIAGGAYYAGKRRQEARERERAELARAAALEVRRTDAKLQTGADVRAPVRVPGPSQETIEKLERLGKLRVEGVLTGEEFASYKASLLNR